MTDREANNAQAAKKFARQLHGRFHLPVHMADERLTSREAWAQLGREAGKDPTKVDSYAAKLILETWLNE
jgi:putative Holliday junction resolvase